MELAAQTRLAAAGVTAREAEVLEAIGLRLTNREPAYATFLREGEAGGIGLLTSLYPR